MTAIKNINIPQPCHQSWQHMIANKEGRHCASCCKTVVDFTRMSDGEIIQYLSEKTNVCGRIEQYQLVHINSTLSAKKLNDSWLKRIVVVLGLMGSVFLKANAQSKQEIVKTQDNNRKKHANDNNLLTVRSLSNIPQAISIDTNQIKPYQIFPETTLTAVMGGMIAVSLESSNFDIKKIWIRVKKNFGLYYQPVADSFPTNPTYY